VRQRLVFEVGDDLFDDGVIAVLGLHQRDVFGAVGDEGEVPPVGEQLGLRAEQASAADDQPALAVGRFGDLRLASVGVVDALPVLLGDLLDGPLTLAGRRLRLHQALRVSPDPRHARRLGGAGSGSAAGAGCGRGGSDEG